MDSLTLLLLAGIGATGVLLLVLLADLRPRAALLLAFPLVLIANTKFRSRDPDATLSGALDWQVLLELGLYGGIALVLVVATLKLRPRLARPTLMEGLLLAFAGVAAASTAWSATPSVTLVRAGQLVVLLWLGLVSLRWLGADGVRRALTWSVVAYVILFTLQALVIPAAATDWSMAGWPGTTRFAWWAVHPITVGTLAGAGVVLLVVEALFVPRERWQRIGGVPLLVCLPFVFAVLVGAWSRGPMFATFAACGVLFLRRALRPWLVWLPLGVAGVVAGLLVVVGTGDLVNDFLQRSVMSENFLVRFITRGNDMRYLSSLGGRINLWREISVLFLERPWTGWGYTASRGLLPDIMRWASYSHNALAQTLLDVGILGSVPLWLALFRSLIADVLKPRWTGMAEGSARAFAFGSLLMLCVLSVVSETFAGPPGYELLLLVCGVLVSDRVRVPVAVREEAPRRMRPVPAAARA